MHIININNMPSLLENIRLEQNRSNSNRKPITVGKFSSTSFDTNNIHAYNIIYKEQSLSEEVEKIMSDIDSGNVKMVTQTAAEFISDMKKDLAENEK
jgi:hypothetical protein